MQNHSDERIKAYFLGKLPDDAASAVEIEVAAEPSTAELFRAFEEELIEDYLRGELTADEARAFETNYLITETRRARLRAAEDFLNLLAPPPRIVGLFGGRSRRVAAGLSLLLLLLAAAAIGSYLAAERFAPPERVAVAEPGPSLSAIAEPAAESPNPANAANAPAAANLSGAANSDNSPAAPERHRAPAAVRPENRTAERVAPTLKNGGAAAALVVRLSPVSLRADGEQSVTIPPHVKTVRLRLDLEDAAAGYKFFRAVLRTPENETVAQPPPGSSPELTIAAERLENRTYIISLEGRAAGGRFESLADYTFRVRR